MLHRYMNVVQSFLERSEGQGLEKKKAPVQRGCPYVEARSVCRTSIVTKTALKGVLRLLFFLKAQKRNHTQRCKGEFRRNPRSHAQLSRCPFTSLMKTTKTLFFHFYFNYYEMTWWRPSVWSPCTNPFLPVVYEIAPTHLVLPTVWSSPPSQTTVCLLPSLLNEHHNVCLLRAVNYLTASSSLLNQPFIMWLEPQPTFTYLLRAFLNQPFMCFVPVSQPSVLAAAATPHCQPPIVQFRFGGFCFLATVIKKFTTRKNTHTPTRAPCVHLSVHPVHQLRRAWT